MTSVLSFFFPPQAERQARPVNRSGATGLCPADSTQSTPPASQNRKETIPPGSGNGEAKTQGIIIELFVIEESDAMFWSKVLQVCKWVTVTEGHCAR